MHHGLVTNDRFDPLRAGSQESLLALSEASSARSGRSRVRIRPRRSLSARPEAGGHVSNPRAEVESSCCLDCRACWSVMACSRARWSPWNRRPPSWADLAPLLSRSEWRGELRRGYFVEGLSGVQYASADAAGELARLAARAGRAPLRWSSFARPTRQISTAAGHRSTSNCSTAGSLGCRGLPGHFLVLRAGRPVLIIESHGKRLTGLASASPGRHRFRIESSSRLHRTGPANPQGRIV